MIRPLLVGAGVALALIGAGELGRAGVPPAAGPTVDDLRRQLSLERSAWRRERARLVAGYGGDQVDVALRVASVTYGVPLGELRRVALCESRLRPWAVNRSSGAAGLMQFLPSTWRRYPYREVSVFNPYAAALAAAHVRRRDGSWRQWECKP